MSEASRSRPSERQAFEMNGIAVPPGGRAVIDLPVSVMSNHSPVTLSVHVIHGKQPGPTMFVSAAVHGDEIIGVEIIRRLIRTQQMKSIKGTLLCIPVVNAFGFVNHDRYLPDKRDLNRSFPGAASGSLAARLARLFMKEVVSRCEAGIDLHSAAVHRVNLPQIRIDGSSKRARELAEAFSPPVILTSKLREGSLRLAARQQGVDVLVYESGEALRFDETAVRIGVRGILRVLNRMGMVTNARGLVALHRPRLSRSSFWLRAPRGGILRAGKPVGAEVFAGETVAVICDPFGEREAQVRAEKPAIVIGRTNLPIVNEGDALFHLAELAPTAEGAPPPDEDEVL